jgi:hypothetical protein
LVLVAVLALTGSGCSVLDTINRLPGTIAGTSDKQTADYTDPAQMTAALQTLKDSLKGDSSVYFVSMGKETAEAYTLATAVEVRNGKAGTLAPALVTRLPVAAKGLPLDSFDPAAARTRLSAEAEKRGCQGIERVTLVLAATGKMLSELTCSLNGERVDLVEGPNGKVVDEVDLTTKEGLVAAVGDVLAVNVPGARYTVFAVQYNTSRGVPSVLTVAGRVSTIRSSRTTSELPTLSQTNTGVDPVAKDFDITGITAQTFATVYDAAKKKCGNVDTMALALATDGSVRFLSGTFSCPYTADRTGKPI